MWPKYLGMLAKLDTARVGRGEETWINKCCLMCRDPSELESQQFLSQFFDLTVFLPAIRSSIQKITQQAEQRERRRAMGEGGKEQGGWEKEVTFCLLSKGMGGRGSGPPRYFLYVTDFFFQNHTLFNT